MGGPQRPCIGAHGASARRIHGVLHLGCITPSTLKDKHIEVHKNRAENTLFHRPESLQ